MTDERAPAQGSASRLPDGTAVRLGVPARRSVDGPDVAARRGSEQRVLQGEHCEGSEHAEAATVAGESLGDAARLERLRALESLIELLRPAVQSDGGDLVLVSADPERGDVEVQLEGACSSCAISATTLQAGVERILKDRLPWVRSVRGRVDDAFDMDLSVSLGRGGYVPRV